MSSQPARQYPFNNYTPPPTRSKKLSHCGVTVVMDDSMTSDLSYPQPVQQLTMSDTAHIHNWQSMREQRVPQTLPTHQKFGGRMLARAETVAEGLGALEDSTGPECGICMEEYSEEGFNIPRILSSCGHSYCTGCLEQLLLKSLHTMPCITCPKCSKVTDVPNHDVITLPKNFALLEVIQGSLQSSSRPVSPSQAYNHSSVLMRCEEHNGDNLSSFCIKCGELVCSSCLLYGRHRDHNTQTLFVNEAAIQYRKKLTDLMPEVHRQRGRMETALTAVQHMTASVKEMGDQLMEETDEVFAALTSIIEARRNALKLEIMERTQIRVEALTDQAGDLKECMEKIVAVEHIANQLLRGDDYSLLQRATLTMDEIEGVFVNPPQTRPRAQNDLHCEFSNEPKEEVVSQINAYGAVRPAVGMVSNLFVKPYHDGFSVKWDGHNYTDNEGTTYYLQRTGGGSDEYRSLYRGSATKFNDKDDLIHEQPYKFRVQVRTTEGFGGWSQPFEASKAAPEFRWHENWRNVKIELSRHRLEAACTKGGAHNFWATFAGDKLFLKGKQNFAQKHYFEIEILDLGKSKSLRKLAFGISSCNKSQAHMLPWQDGKHPIGQWVVPSWSFEPMMGVVYSQTTPKEGAEYCSGLSLAVGDKLGMLVELDEGKVSYFINGRDLGPAFERIEVDSVLPCVSIQDKMRVLLRFPPPPYRKRTIKLTRLASRPHQSI